MESMRKEDCEMAQFDPRDKAQDRTYYGKPGLFGLLLVLGFVLYFFFG